MDGSTPVMGDPDRGQQATPAQAPPRIPRRILDQAIQASIEETDRFFNYTVSRQFDPFIWYS